MPATGGDGDSVRAGRRLADPTAATGELALGKCGVSGHSDAARYGIAVVVLARDEEAVISPLLDQLRRQLTPFDSLHLVADHCRDDTAALGQKSGARVHSRFGGRAGKGFALHWWLERMRAEGTSPDGVLILDADSRPAPDLLAAIRTRLMRQEQAVQARVIPQVAGEQVIPLLAAFSEELEQAVFDRLRSRLGWSVRLRGTGMAFQANLLARLAPELATSVEDAELSLLLADSRCRVVPAPETYVCDPKPISASAAQRQRARWLQGQGQLLRCHPARIGRSLLRGPADWSLLSSILFKPHSFILPLKAIAASAGVGLWLARVVGATSALALAAPLIVALVAVLLGLAACPRDRRRRYLRALIGAYRYPLMWIRSLQLAFASDDPWLRVRDHGPEPGITEATPASS